MGTFSVIICLNMNKSELAVLSFEISLWYHHKFPHFLASLSLYSIRLYIRIAISIISHKLENQETLHKTRKFWYLLLFLFWLLLSKINFCKGGWTFACIFTPFSDFFHFPISWNPIKSYKSLSNFLGNSYTNFIILDVKLCFTCGELNLPRNTVNCRNIMSLIVYSAWSTWVLFL